ncbi:hypothetical protein EV175_001035 [Coemansia sp. RSA 1933]|nr:hypothetical protein EV175_001035 [Coemansia sp. RSA 1933]
MDDLMTAHLANIYKRETRELHALGFNMKLEIDVQESETRINYRRLRVGDPSAYDFSIPYAVRSSKHTIGWGNLMAIAVDNEILNLPKAERPKTNGQNEWISLEVGFVATASVKLDLYEGKNLVRSDAGIMRIPISMSSPHYLGVNAVINSTSPELLEDDQEPFNWRVCGLFCRVAQDYPNDVATKTK